MLKITRLKETRLLTLRTVSIWALGLLCVLFIIFSVPWNMDEFLPYHALACMSPSQQFNVYSQSCFGNPAELGPIDYQRSYPYIGISSSLLLAPFFALWQSFWTPYLVGVLSLSAIIWGLARSFSLPTRMVPSILLFFPLSLVVLHDQGPVRIGLIVMAWTPVVTVAFLRSSRWKPAWFLLLAIMWTVATEDKAFFVFLIPGLILFSIAGIYRQGVAAHLKSNWKALTVFFGLASGSCLGFLIVLQVQGMPYLEFLAQQSGGRRLKDLAFSAVSGASLTLNWPFTTNIVSDYAALGRAQLPGPAHVLAKFFPWGTSPEAVAVIVLSIMSIAGLLAIYLWSLLRSINSPNPSRRVEAALLLASAAALALGAIIAVGQHTHHFIYAEIPLFLIVTLAFSIKAQGAFKLAIALGGITTATLLATWITPNPASASREIREIVDVAYGVSDKDTIMNCASWGCYFPYSLVDAEQIPVVFADQVDDMRRLESRTRNLGRNIVHLCFDCSLTEVSNLYSKSDVIQVKADTLIWKAFKVSPRAIED